MAILRAFEKKKPERDKMYYSQMNLNILWKKSIKIKSAQRLVFAHVIKEIGKINNNEMV